MLSDILHFVEFLLVIALALIALFVVLIVAISKMPNDKPLKVILTALSHRVGLTGGLLMVDPVATAVPVVGELWDVATIAWLVYFWYTFFRQLPAMRAAWNACPYASTQTASRRSPQRHAQPEIDNRRR
jgi:hypothetical protein